MSPIFLIARREYAETTRSKAFLAGLLLTPLILAGIAFFGNKAESWAGSAPPKTLCVTDRTGKLEEPLREAFANYNKGNSGRQVFVEIANPGSESFDAFATAQQRRIMDGKYSAWIVLDADIVDGAGKLRVYVDRPMPDDLQAQDRATWIINRALADQRAKARGLSMSLLDEIRRPASVEQINIQKPQQRSEKSGDMIVRMMVPFFFMFMMFMGIFGMGQQILTSVIEEKSSRVMEVLLSAVSGFELMAGKILGQAASGLTVVLLWTITAFGAAQWKGVELNLTPAILTCFILYYALGFMLLSAILAAIGSICNTIKDAQSLMMPITMLLIVPMVSWFALVQNPNGAFATALSFIPPVTPVVMILRVATMRDFPLAQVIGSMALLAASVVLTIWAAGKIFRVGILMYGKRPGLREVLRWLGRE